MRWLGRPTTVQAMRRAAVQATLAPSVSNSQPWRLVLGGGALELWADRGRQLPSDTDGRHLLISCGCALLNARAAVAADGYAVIVNRFPDPLRPDLLARLTTVEEPATEESAGDCVTQVVADGEGTGGLDDRVTMAVLDPVIRARRMSHQLFTDPRIPQAVIGDLMAAAAAEDAELILLGSPHDGWAGGVFGERRAFGSSPAKCTLLVTTAAETPWDWLRAGEALERTLLTVTVRGYAANVLDDVSGGPLSRALLAADLALTAHPQVMVQIGSAPGTPATRRRRLVDVLTEYPWTEDQPATPVAVPGSRVLCR